MEGQIDNSTEHAHHDGQIGHPHEEMRNEPLPSAQSVLRIRRAQEVPRAAEGHLQGAAHIGKLRERNALAQQNVPPCLDTVGSMHKLTAIENETVLVKHFQALLHAVNTMQLERYVKRDFSDVFEKYIKA